MPEEILSGLLCPRREQYRNLSHTKIMRRHEPMPAVSHHRLIVVEANRDRLLHAMCGYVVSQRFLILKRLDMWRLQIRVLIGRVLMEALSLPVNTW